MKALTTSAMFALLALAACSKSNPYYCEGKPDNLCAADGSVGPMGCDKAADCTDSKAPVCDMTAHECVACDEGMTAACTGTMPVCSNHECVACTSHGNCDSNVCLPSGACAMPDDVAYVTPNGNGTNCSASDPCSFATAITSTAPYVRVLGTDTLAVTGMSIARNVTVYGEGAKIDPTGDGPLFTITGTAEVAFYDIALQGATTSTGNAIEMAGGKLSLTRVRVADNQGMGVSATSGTVTISQSTFTVNDRGAISLADGVQFNITNNFVHHNGNSINATVGGAKLGMTTVGTRTFEFNTLVDNQVKTGSTFGGGVTCDEQTIVAPNNIIARNRVNGSATATNANWLGVCGHPSSIIDSDVASLMFVAPDTDPFNYRLLLTSSAVDHGAASTTMIDIDGDKRPQGSAPDIGADEYK